MSFWNKYNKELQVKEHRKIRDRGKLSGDSKSDLKINSNTELRQNSYYKNESESTSFKSSIEDIESRFQSKQYDKLKRYKSYIENEKKLQKELSSINQK